MPKFRLGPIGGSRLLWYQLNVDNATRGYKVGLVGDSRRLVGSTYGIRRGKSWYESLWRGPVLYGVEKGEGGRVDTPLINMITLRAVGNGKESEEQEYGEAGRWWLCSRNRFELPSQAFKRSALKRPNLS
jgi:hypothetical protein